MAMNPMQKKARTSFLLGMLLTLLITGIVIGALIYMLGQEKAKQTSIIYKNVYVATQEIKSGERVITTFNMTDAEGQNETVQINVVAKSVDSSLVPSNYINPLSENLKEYLTSTSIAKLMIEPNTILTTDMIYSSGTADSNDLRIQEYNMIILPTLLKEKECIDIRLRLPSGEDYIVLSKKYVEKTDESTIWIKVREDEV